jgi:nickel-dependent lactate racemase
MIVKVPQFPWYGDTELELDFPDSWEVVVPRMKGEKAPALSSQQIRDALRKPIGTPRLAEMAKGKKEVCIIFDDLTRPTKADKIVPHVLDELHEGGIKDENIRFIAALGLHGAMKLMDFQKKLGEDIPQKYFVFNHNPYENCTYLGETSRGIPVSVNAEFMACDLKVSIGSLVPHPTAGFGGGGKMILPGVSSTESIASNHGKLNMRSETGAMILDTWGRVDDNIQRLDMEEIARMAGLDFSINALVNIDRDTIAIYCGDLVEAHREGVKMARQVYATESPPEADIVVANTYAKANETALVAGLGTKLLKESGGDLVVIGNIPEGQICHYLGRSFGKTIGGQLYGAHKDLPPRVNRMFALGPYIDKAGLDWIGAVDKITILNSWTEIIGALKNGNGSKPRAVVIPDGTLQYFPHSGLPKGETVPGD